MNGEQLNELIRSEIAKRGTEIDPWELTDAIIALIPDDELRPTMHVVMRRYVAHRLQPHRAQDEPVAPLKPTPAPRIPSPIPGPSQRSIGAAAWTRKLNAMVSVEGAGVYKRLGACTFLDIRSIAVAYAKRSKAMDEQCQWYTRIAEAMAATGAKTVADLPETTLRPLVEKVAA